MTARLIEGKARAAEIHAEVKERAAALRARGVVPKLVMMRVGEDPASVVYLRKKSEAAEECGVEAENLVFPADADPAEVRDTMRRLNEDIAVHGILLQLPLPDGWNAEELLALMNPDKDVDGFHTTTVGRLVRGEPGFVPCTPLGIEYLLHREGIPLKGTPVAVVGRSNVVGRPLANLLSQKGNGRDATVVLLHSRSRDIGHWTHQADVLVAAAGAMHMIQPDMIKPGSTVIDVGMHRMPHPEKPGKTKLTGDVHPDAIEVAGALTPVPGGVGPMTVAMLLRNTVDAASGHGTRPFGSD